MKLGVKTRAFKTSGSQPFPLQDSFRNTDRHVYSPTYTGHKHMQIPEHNR